MLIINNYWLIYVHLLIYFHVVVTLSLILFISFLFLSLTLYLPLSLSYPFISLNPLLLTTSPLYRISLLSLFPYFSFQLLSPVPPRLNLFLYPFHYSFLSLPLSLFLPISLSLCFPLSLSLLISFFVSHLFIFLSISLRLIPISLFSPRLFYLSLSLSHPSFF